MVGPQKVTLLNAVAATGASTDVDPVSGEYSFQVTGTFVGTVAFEATIDGTNWEELGTATAEGLTHYTGKLVSSVRANVTAYTSGSITVTFIG